MSKMYESLEGLMQKTLQRGKLTTAIARVKSSTASSLDDEMERLQKMVVERLGGLKAAVKAGEAVVAGEAKRTEQLVESLKANVSALEASVKEKEETLRRNEAAAQSMEKNLTEKVAALEKQLRDNEKMVREKEATVHTLEQTLTAKIQTLESQLRDNEKLLASRDAQVDDLTSQLQALTHGIKEMSSFFKQAEALAAVQTPGAVVVPISSADPSKGGKKKSAVSPLTGVTAISAQETMPSSFFDTLTRELTEVLGPMASVVVRDRIAALGESMEKFPKARVLELLETVGQEILDDSLKVSFRERLAVNL
jgi:myosin heavy subunit